MVPWKKIRLELGPTVDQPLGSVSRAYLLQLPLRPSGHIDPVEVQTYPLRATARRYRASEADRSGYVVPARERWLCVHTPAADAANVFASFKDCALAIGGTVAILEGGRVELPFLVNAIEEF